MLLTAAAINIAGSVFLAMVSTSDTFADQRVLPRKKELALSEIIIST